MLTIAISDNPYNPHSATLSDRRYRGCFPSSRSNRSRVCVASDVPVTVPSRIAISWRTVWSQPKPPSGLEGLADRYQSREQDDAEQLVPIVRPGSQVDCPVPGVYVGDTRYQAGADEVKVSMKVEGSAGAGAKR